MDQYADKIDSIIKKINKLMDQYINLEEKHLKVLQEQKQLKNTVKEQKVQIIDLSNKLKDIKLSNQIKNSDDEANAALKARINEFVKEIDKCMAMLNH